MMQNPIKLQYVQKSMLVSIYFTSKELDLSATFESISSLISKCKLVYKKVLLLGGFFLHIFASVAQPCFLNICFGLWL